MFREININLMITILISVMGFVINSIFARYIGIEKLGLMKLFLQLTAYLNLAELGLGTAATYILYKPLVEKDYERVSIIFCTINKLYKKIGFFILGLGILFTPLLSYIIIQKLEITDYICWILYVTNIYVSYLYIKFIILYTADQKFIKIRIFQGILKLFINLIQILVLIKFESFMMYVIFFIFENIIQLICYKYYFKKNYVFIKNTQIFEKNIVKDLKKLFWHKISGVIVFNTDYIIISKFISISMVGIYSSYLMVVNIIILIFNAIVGVISPKIGKIIAIEKSKDKIFEKWKEINEINVYLGTVSSIIFYIYVNDFVKIWLGKRFVLENITVLLITINLFFQITRKTTEVFKDNLGYFDDTHLPVMEASINLILSIILVMKIGINGVIIGTVVSTVIVIYILRQLLILKKCFNKGYTVWISLQIKYMVEIFIILFIVKRLNEKLEFLFEINNLYQFFYKIGIYSSIILLITGMIFFIQRKILIKNLRGE